MQPVTVRPAGPDDAAAVAALVHSAYRSDESRTGWTTEADLVGGQRTDADMVRTMVTGEGSVVLVATTAEPPVATGGQAPSATTAEAPLGTAGNALVACCHLEHRGDVAHLGMFAVRPGLQGSGLGRRMLAVAEAWAVHLWGVAALELTVLDRRSELIAWYVRCGFTLTGARQPFPSHDIRFGIPREPDLALLGMRRPVGTDAPPGAAPVGTPSSVVVTEVTARLD